MFLLFPLFLSYWMDRSKAKRFFNSLLRLSSSPEFNRKLPTGALDIVVAFGTAENRASVRPVDGACPVLFIPPLKFVNYVVHNIFHFLMKEECGLDRPYGISLLIFIHIAMLYFYRDILRGVIPHDPKHDPPEL